MLGANHISGIQHGDKQRQSPEGNTRPAARQGHTLQVPAEHTMLWHILGFSADSTGATAAADC